MKSLRIALFTLAGAAALGGVALAKGGPGGPPEGPPGGTPGLRELMEDLNLTDEQEAMVKDLRESGREMRERHHESREATGDAILAELAKEKPDAKAMHKLIDQNLAELSTDLHNRVDDALAIHATLSPEQRATLVEGLEELREEREERRDAWKEEGGPHGPPH